MIQQASGKKPVYLVIDAISLDLLGMGIDNKFKIPAGNRKPGTKNIQRFIDIIDFLGENGIQVIIPEMVAIETEGIFAGSGGCMHDLFKENGRYKPNVPIKKFLQDAAKGEKAGITIMHIDSSSSEISNAVNAYRAAYNKGTNGDKDNAKKEIAALDKKRVGNGWGEKHASEIISKLDGSIFFLSEDNGARYLVEKENPEKTIGKLNIKGLLHAILNHKGPSKFGERMGLKPKMDDHHLPEMLESMEKQHVEVSMLRGYNQYNLQGHAISTPTELKVQDKGIIDSSRNWASDSRPINNWVFIDTVIRSLEERLSRNSHPRIAATTPVISSRS